MKAIHVGALILLGAIWGASFLFIREAAHDFGPIVLMFLRVFLAGLVLIPIAPFLLRNRKRLNKSELLSYWKQFLIMGAFNSAIPFTLIAFSELTITASLASILNSLTPLCTAIIAAIWVGEKLTGQKISGAVLGIIGVMVLVGGSPLDLNNEFLLAVVASIGAAVCYGIGTVYASRHITGLPAIQASIGQLLGASLILALPSVATVPDTMPSMRAIISLVALILLSTSFAYLIYFYLLRQVGPTRTASVTFLVPVFGTIWGIVFLDEPFSWGMLLGMAIILLSVGLVLGAKFEKKKPAIA
ncbi:MAG: DMT family transporter [Phototrophicaceae bacterium]